VINRTWVESIPTHWDLPKLSELVEVVNGAALSSDGFSRDDGLPVVRIRDLLRGFTRTRFAGDTVGAPFVGNGDLLIGMDGDFNSVVWSGGDALLNQRVCCLRPSPRLDNRFLSYALPLTLREINDLTFYTTVKHLSSVDLLSSRFPRPPISTQSRIADFLDSETGRIDALVNKKQRLINLLEEKRTAMITQAVTKGLDPTVPMKNSGIPWASEIPARWSAAHVIRLARLGS